MVYEVVLVCFVESMQTKQLTSLKIPFSVNILIVKRKEQDSRGLNFANIMP